MDEIVVTRTGRYSNNNRQCVRTINDYWLKRGYNINARVEMKLFKTEHNRGFELYYHEEIVSDSVGGIPTKRL